MITYNNAKINYAIFYNLHIKKKDRLFWEVFKNKIMLSLLNYYYTFWMNLILIIILNFLQESKLKLKNQIILKENLNKISLLVK
jgi:hypothetical protein